jgi:hypothetical protein
VRDLAGKIEEIIADDKVGRGIRNLIVHGDIERSARSLLDGTTILITTGFYISEAGSGETDGPMGAVALALALDKLGKDAVLVVDGPNKPLLECALDAVRLDISIVLFPISGREAFAKELLCKYRPSHIVALERVGPARDGRYYDMRGTDISREVAHIDVLFTAAAEMGIKTIGMGDGGNEIGMGKVYDGVIGNVPNGKNIACVIPTDYLIVSGVSNWAAHGICACMSILTKNNLMMEESLERELLHALVRCGAVDGCTLRREETVDSLKEAEYFEVVNKLREIVKNNILP